MWIERGRSVEERGGSGGVREGCGGEREKQGVGKRARKGMGQAEMTVVHACCCPYVHADESGW